MPASAATRIIRAASSTLARYGAARLAPWTTSLGGEDTFLAHVERLLSVEGLVFAVHLGPPRANRKPVLHLMRESGESIAYAKIGINAFTCSRVRQEAKALERLGEVSTVGLDTPALIAAGEWRGLDYLVMEALDSDSASVPDDTRRARALRSLVSAFPVVESVVSESAWWKHAMSELARCEDSSEVERLRRAAAKIVSRYPDHRLVVGAAHGDWSRWNMSASGSGLLAWDWERFSDRLPVGWDEVNFRLGSHPGGPAAALKDPQLRAHLARLEPSQVDLDLLLSTYLFHRGVSRAAGLQETGVRSAALRQWLLPALEDLVGPSASA